jgi:lipopolysaccharide assembly outer membrane protein LptD (OstA)
MRRSAESLLVAGVVLLHAALLATPTPAGAQEAELGDREVVLDADEVAYDQERDIYEASGNVRVVQEGGRTLYADWLVFNRSTRIGVAIGHVRLEDRQDVLLADFAAIDMRTLLALASNARLDTPAPGLDVEGKTIRRTGVNTYEVEEGVFTTCRCDPPTARRPWEIEVEKANVRVGGYAVARNLRFRALGLPVFYLPWIAFPVKTERQTGFLLPSFSRSSRSGTELEVPFFLTLGRSAQLTFRPDLMTARGLKTGVDLEYVFGEEGYGNGGVAGLAGDNEVDRDDLDTPFSDDRWAYWLRHEQPLGEGIRLGLDVNRASDNQYTIDFDDIPGTARTQRFLDSTGWATLARRGYYAGLEAAHVDDLQSPNDVDRDDFLLQRLPDARAATLPRTLGSLPLRLGFDTRYTWFHRSDPKSRLGQGRRPVRGLFFDTGADALFDEQEADASGLFPGGDLHGDNFNPANRESRSRGEGNGRFDEGELLADDGHRMDLYPSVSLPWRLGVVETLSEVGFRETLYFPDEQSSERREIWTFRAEARTRLGRRYHVRGNELRHQIEPRVTLVGVSTPSQDANPLFIPASSVDMQRLIEGDPRLLTRDPTDRVPDARLVVFQIGNRLYTRSLLPDQPVRLLGELRVGTSYDFLESQLERLFAQSYFQPGEHLLMGLDVGWDPDERRLEDMTAALSWLASAGHTLRLSYRYLRRPVVGFDDFERDDDIFDEAERDFDKISQINLNSLLAISSRLDVFLNGYLSLEDSSTNGGEFGFVLLSKCRCWDLVASIERRTRPDDTRFNLQLNLAGLGRRSRVPGHPERIRRDEQLGGFLY